MRAKAECQVLDESVRPVEATGLTAQTGLAGDSTDDADSSMNDDSIINAKDQD